MAAIEDLIKNIADPNLREQIAAEVAKLKAGKKFGLVFEEHLPEMVRLPSLPVKAGARVLKKDDKAATSYRVVAEVNGKKVRIAPEAGGAEETVERASLVVAKAFGEPMYPALVPVDAIERAPGKPWHVLINADNYHALQLLLYGYEGKVDLIYIDPPYNTGARDWKYNNDFVDKTDSFRHSKWLSMMKKRLTLAKRLLKPDGVLIVTIDDNEMNSLGLLLDELFPQYLKHQVTIVINPGGTYRINFARVHEYAYYVCPSDRETIDPIPIAQGEFDFDSPSKNDVHELWKLRRTGAESAHRHQRPKQFYAIYVDEETLQAVHIGPALKLAEKFATKKVDGLTPVYPIDGEGTHRVWRYGRETMTQKISEGKILAKRASDGTLTLYYRSLKKNTKRHKTVWWEGSHSSVGTASTVMVDAIIGRPNAFPFPKSLNAVRDSIAAVCRNRKSAVIVDFFAGSGTTLHATALLNKEDGGRRRCVLVSYNEVDEKSEKQLAERAIEPGMPEWEAAGICNAVTWPRCKWAITGRRDDGSVPVGKYGDGTPIATGIAANAAYFKLEFLDPADVSRGDKFESILPILWMVAGCLGPCTLARGASAWFMPDKNPFAVLIKEDQFDAFHKKLAEREDVAHVFLVTDSVEAFQEMARDLGPAYRCIQLYKSYLDTFKINLAEPGGMKEASRAN